MAETCAPLPPVRPVDRPGARRRAPLSEYLRYEFSVYRHIDQAGEDDRVLDLTEQTDPGLPAEDFWLFDDTAVVRMANDAKGTQLGHELLDDADPALRSSNVGTSIRCARRD